MPVPQLHSQSSLIPCRVKLVDSFCELIVLIGADSGTLEPENPQPTSAKQIALNDATRFMVTPSS